METSEVFQKMSHGQNSKLGKLDDPLIEAELGWIAKVFCCGRSQKRCDHMLTGELDLRTQRRLSSSRPWNVCLLAFPAPTSCSKDIALR